jgi:hypothetical protein
LIFYYRFVLRSSRPIFRRRRERERKRERAEKCTEKRRENKIEGKGVKEIKREARRRGKGDAGCSCYSSSYFCSHVKYRFFCVTFWNYCTCLWSGLYL